MLAVQPIDVADNFEIAVARGKPCLRDAVDQFLVFLPVGNQILDISYLHSFFARQGKELRFPRHRAVGIHNLAAKSGGRKPCHAAEIHRRFRVTRSLQHAPFPGAKRKEMSRPTKIFRLRIRRNGFPARQRTLGRRDARPRFHVIDGFQKRGLMIVRISPNHRPQIQFVGQRTVHRHTDDTARLHRHPIHIFRRRKICRADVIAFIFARFRVLHDDDVSFFELRDDVFDGIVLKFHASPL